MGPVASTHVTAPDGTRWRVSRSWLPASPKWRGKLDVLEVLHLGDLAEVPVIGGVALAITVGVFMAFVLLPVFALLVEVVVFVAVVGAAFFVRVVKRRPWPIEARRIEESGETPFRCHVKGFRNSGRFCRDVAERLADGRTLPDRQS